ncbi:MAG: hypothetical protein JXB43_07480 [Dehalococcoidia bacterium]|nr:hypothetical protein [Dehalococcoidia bacterium]
MPKIAQIVRILSLLITAILLLACIVPVFRTGAAQATYQELPANVTRVISTDNQTTTSNECPECSAGAMREGTSSGQDEPETDSDHHSLHQRFIFTLPGGYVAAGVGMRNRGYGDITISGIPSGSTIEKAYLYWDVLYNSSRPSPELKYGNFNGAQIEGTLIGSGSDPCWDSVIMNYAYRADVTSLVTGNGVYSLTDFASSRQDGCDPWICTEGSTLMEGASLVIIYRNPTLPVQTIVVYDGATTLKIKPVPSYTITITDFIAPPTVESASITYIGADGQDGVEDAAECTYFNGVQIADRDWEGSDTQAGPNYSRGNLWDTNTYDVTSLVQPGDTSATARVKVYYGGWADCLVWVAAVFSVSAEPSSTHRVAYIPVRYTGGPEPTHTIADLRERAQLVADYYKQQSYGAVNLDCQFIYSQWQTLPPSYQPAGYDDRPAWKIIRDKAIADAKTNIGMKEEDYQAIIVIQPACMRSFAGVKEIITSEKTSYATWAHEIGHAIREWGDGRLGFYDYYPDKDSPHGNMGNIGYWGLMGKATLMDPTAPIMSFNKVSAGWLNYKSIGKTDYGIYPIGLLKDMGLSDNVSKYEANTSAAGYYIFEGREPVDEIVEDYLLPFSGYTSCRPYWPDFYSYMLEKNKGILMYRVVTPQYWVYSVPNPAFGKSAGTKVTLLPGTTYFDDEAKVKFTAIESGGQLSVDISANPVSNKSVVSLFRTSWEMPGADVQYEPIPSQWDPDIDLHAYAYDGKEIGMNYETGEYKIEMVDARTTGNTPGGGPEWISLPTDENAYYEIDPTPLREWANELNVEVSDIRATWQIVYYDEESTRRESEPITLDISLGEPAILGLEASIDTEPDKLNLKSKGQWITCWIELPAGYDVNNIDLSTVLLDEKVSAEGNPKYGFVKNPEITDKDEDGLPELMVKFDRAAVHAVVQPSDNVTISVLGEVLKDQIPTPFHGTDTIQVISHGK